MGRLRKLVFWAATLLAGAATPAALARGQVLLAYGDSLTQGYGLPPEEGFVPQLEAWLAARGADVTVINVGVSGDTTAGGLARLDWTLAEPADAMILTLGGNDLLRGMDPTLTRSNLAAMLDKIRAKGMPVLLVPMTAPGNYGADYKTAFDAIYPDLAALYGARLAPPFLTPILTQSDREAATRLLMQPDGIHPNAQGVALVVDALGPQVLTLLGLPGD